MKKSKKIIRYTKSHVKPVEKSDRIILPVHLKGKTNPQIKFKFTVGDTVNILSGDDKGKSGKVLKVIRKKYMVVVEGINLKKRHKKLPNQETGSITEKEYPIYASKVALKEEK